FHVTGVQTCALPISFTFQYSTRPGTPAAEMPDQVPKPVVQERYERLVALVEEISLAENERLVGSTVEVLVAVGEGRKDDATGRLSGRARDGRLVHLRADPAQVRPGDVQNRKNTQLTTSHVTDSYPVYCLRNTSEG